jgi:hypothetical protein
MFPHLLRDILLEPIRTSLPECKSAQFLLEPAHVLDNTKNPDPDLQTETPTLLDSFCSIS